MQTASGIPRPSREPINRYPVKVTLIIETTPSQIQVTLRPRCDLKMQTAPEPPRPFAKIGNQFPAKVTPLLSKQSGSKSSYFQEGRTLPREPSTVPERHPPSRGMDLEGFEPSPVPWQGTVLPLHHRPTSQSLLQSGHKLRPSGLHLLKRSFVLEQALAVSARPLKSGTPQRPCDI
jgi:hypothetical protein